MTWITGWLSPVIAHGDSDHIRSRAIPLPPGVVRDIAQLGVARVGCFGGGQSRAGSAAAAPGPINPASSNRSHAAEASKNASSMNICPLGSSENISRANG